MARLDNAQWKKIPCLFFPPQDTVYMQNKTAIGVSEYIAILFHHLPHTISKIHVKTTCRDRHSQTSVLITAHFCCAINMHTDKSHSCP